MVEVEECTRVRPAFLWTTPKFLANTDAVDLGPPLTLGERTSLGVPVVGKLEAGTSEKQLNTKPTAASCFHNDNSRDQRSLLDATFDLI